MSNRGILYVILALVALGGMIPIMGKIGSSLSSIPAPTPIDVPNALRKVDSTYASESARPKIATPSQNTAPRR